MEKYTKESLTEVVTKSKNYVDVCRKLNIGTTYGNRQTIKKYIKMYEINTSHFYIPPPTNENFKKRELLDILVKDSTYNHTGHLKERLYSEGLKKPICELCGQDENWNGKKLSLILDHINGDNCDNRLENLRIVCPNCDSTLDTFSGRNISRKKEKNYCDCGCEVFENGNDCVKCASIKRRKSERPSKDNLISEIKNLGYSKTGLKYKVSDNTIRKWVIAYGINPKEIK